MLKLTDLPVSKNMLLFLYRVAKGQIMQRPGRVEHFWGTERVGRTSAGLQGAFRD